MAKYFKFGFSADEESDGLLSKPIVINASEAEA